MVIQQNDQLYKYKPGHQMITAGSFIRDLDKAVDHFQLPLTIIVEKSWEAIRSMD